MDDTEKHASAQIQKPIRTWTPAIAPSGMAIYRGKKYPSWSGSFFIGSLRNCSLIRIQLLDDGQLSEPEILLSEMGERIRDVRVAPDESIYVLTDQVDGKLIKIEPRAAGN